MKLSIIIPCFNEEKALPHLFNKLADFRKKANFSYELIFVDDGSLDRTYDLVNERYLKRLDNKVKIIRHEQNKGLGAAIRTGFLHCRGDYIASIDSDCTYDPVYLIEMLKQLENSSAAMITASPYHPKGTTEGVPIRRLFLSKNLSRLYNMVLYATPLQINTYTCGFRIYRRDVIQNLGFESDGFVAMAEILIKLVKKGYIVIEFPAILTVRKYGSSSVRILALIKDHLILLTRIILKRLA